MPAVPAISISWSSWILWTLSWLSRGVVVVDSNVYSLACRRPDLLPGARSPW